MASETEHNVKVNILGDASNLEKEMKEAADEVRSFQKAADRVRKLDSRAAKSLDKLAKKSAKENKKYQKRSLETEKQIAKGIKETTKQMRSKATVSKEDLKSIEQQSKALKGMAKQRKDLQRLEQGGGGGGGGRRWGKGLRGFGRDAAAWGKSQARRAAGAAIGLPIKATMDDISASSEYNLQRGKALVGTGMTMQQSETIRKAAKKNYYTPQEALNQESQLLTSTGNAKAVTSILPEIMRLSRTQGMDAGAFQGISGTMARGGGVQKKQLKESIAAGMASGLKKGRLTEYLKSVNSLMQTYQQNSSGDITGSGINSLLAQLGSTGVSGLQGARGAGVAGKMDAAIRNPKSEAGEMMMLRAVGMGKDKSYFKAKETLQEGILNDTTGMSTIKNVFKQFAERGGGDTEATDFIASNELELTIRQAREVRQALGSGGTEKEIRDKFKKITYQKTPEGELTAQLKDTTIVQHNLVTRTANLDEAVRLLQAEIEALKTQVVGMLVPKLADLIPAMKDLTTAVMEGYKIIDNWDPFGTKEAKEVKDAEEVLDKHGILSTEVEKNLQKTATEKTEFGEIYEHVRGNLEGLLIDLPKRDDRNEDAIHATTLLEQNRQNIATNNSIVNGAGQSNPKPIMSTVDAQGAEVIAEAVAAAIAAQAEWNGSTPLDNSEGMQE